MVFNNFQLTSQWYVKGSVEDVYHVLSKPEDFVAWWPEVYLCVTPLAPGDANGVGKVVRLHTKGKLPYTLAWQARVLEVQKPYRIVIEAQGDLHGRGEWRFRQDGACVSIDYDWTIIVTKRWMKCLMPVLKPVFSANHHWAMQQGKTGLQRQLANHCRG
ncbi:MAG: SRPBCC family protein [Candidatus Competibacteraceae bacterium]|nr:SRPBCC family protein [Candidatus Competibacteraceae bacterium]MCB1803608.1 SRPBCC family protein [Candidatus Competibacteraceae bacterium]MCB1812375.1 SRPBCC family protein [Candidatus Competibacteraceae bacterium]